jgi:drug/metabolite transporter (DMT)-like permease
MSLCVKLAGRRLPSQELVLIRSVITLALSYGTLVHRRIPVRGVHQRLLFLRGLGGTLGLTCFYYSLVHLPLGDATLLQYTNPIWAAMMAALLLHEHIGLREGACLLASLLGVVLVARPAALFGHAHAGLPLGGTLIALFGAVCSASAYVLVRRMGRAEDPQRVVLYLPLVAVPVTLPFAIPGWIWPTTSEWGILLAMGLSTQLAQLFMTRGLQRETTARATAVGYLQVVFAVLWGMLVFHEALSWWSVAGAVVIIASTLVLSSAPRRSRSTDADLADPQPV